MAPEPARLLDLAEAVADGRDVDWGEAETTAGSDNDRTLIRQLRLLAGVADTHRPGLEESDAPAIDPIIGTRWGSFDIRELVGAGSFGSVYRARDVQLDREVALKLIRGNLSNGEEILREGQLLARIRHPHVVTVFGADLIEGRVGLWMELIEGRTLEDVLQQDGPLSAREAALIGTDLCGALAAVHAQGLVHRDIKTRNVMREAGGRIVMMDFGAGRDQLAPPLPGPTTGTPLYMAPEVLRGADSNRQSDIYSLGVLLFRMVTGRYPVEGRSVVDVLNNHKTGARLRLRDLRPDLPPWFIAALERALEPRPEERFKTADEFETALLNAPGRRPPPYLIASIIATCALAVIGAATVWQLRNGTAVGNETIRTIGVRKMKNLTGDVNQDYLAAGFTEGLMSQLGAIKALAIRPAASVDQRGSASAGLTTDAWLEGSVQKVGDRLRISTRLLRAGTGVLVWGGNYEEPESTFFAAQKRAVDDLIRALDLKVSVIEANQLAARYVPEPAAQDLFLRGRFLLEDYRLDPLREARKLLEETVRLAPQFADAHATLAQTYMSLGGLGDLSRDEERRLATMSAEAAVRESPWSAEAALIHADVRFRLHWDWESASTGYARAMELNPNDMDTRNRYTRFLGASGRLSDSLTLAKESLALDPLDPEMYTNLGFALYYLGRYEDAVTHFLDRPLDVAGRRVGLARSYAALGRYPEAIQELAVAFDASHDFSILAELGRTLAASGDRSGAVTILDRLSHEQRRSPRAVGDQDFAYVFVALQDHERALGLLERAVSQRGGRLLWLGVDPRVAPLRGHPRFNKLLGELGTPLTVNR